MLDPSLVDLSPVIVEKRNDGIYLAGCGWPDRAAITQEFADSPVCERDGGWLSIYLKNAFAVYRIVHQDDGMGALVCFRKRSGYIEGVFLEDEVALSNWASRDPARMKWMARRG